MPKIAMFVLAAAVAAGVSAPTAHAAHSRMQFLSPSGDVGCQMGTTPDGWAYAWCTANEPNSVAPGDGVYLVEGEAPGYRPASSPLFFTGQNAPPSLGAGDRRSVGGVTCTIEITGVSCADSATGNGFRVSRGAYQLI